MSNILDTILGIGAYGFASINGHVLALLASSVDEDENLHRSPGAISSSISGSTGQVPHRNRRKVSFGLVCELNQTSIALIHQTTFDWRNGNLSTNTVHAVVVIANGEGFNCPEAYVDVVSLSVPESGICTVSFQITAWRWTPLLGIPTPRTQAAAHPFNNAFFQPIPQWNTSITNTGMPGSALTFNLKFSNQWQYKTLLERTSLPPTPRIVYSGRLLVELQMDVLANINSPPLESGAVSVFLAGGNSGMVSTTQTRILIPLMYRHPQRSYHGLGDQNTIIRWSASWDALGVAPSLF